MTITEVTMTNYRIPKDGLIERMYHGIVDAIGRTPVTIDFVSLRDQEDIELGEIVMPLAVVREFHAKGDVRSRRTTLPYLFTDGLEYLA